jgi:integrase/recombinase XerD
VDRFLAHLEAVDRSPGTVRSYAFDLRDFFTFLEQAQVRWQDVQLEDFGRFANWLRLAPAERSGQLRRLTGRAEHCSATTINRKLSAVGSFYQFHQQHGASFEFLPLSRRRGRGGSWKPLLAHLGGSARPGKELKRRASARIPRTLRRRTGFGGAGCVRPSTGSITFRPAGWIRDEDRRSTWTPA